MLRRARMSASYMSGVSHAGVGVKNWAGDFDCSVCKRKRLIASEFSKKMQEKRRKDPSSKLKCKQCVESAEKAEREAAAAAAKGGKDDEEEPQVCSSCRQSLPASKFTKPQLKKGPSKQRCSECVAAATEAENKKGALDKEAALEEAKKAAARAEASGTVAEKLATSAKLAALEGEMVTGLKPKKPLYRRGSRNSIKRA